MGLRAGGLQLRLLDELGPPALQQLGDPVQDLAPVVRGRPGPPGDGGPGGDDRVAYVLAGGERGVGAEGTVERGHDVRPAGLAARKGAADEQLVRLRYP